MNKEEFRKPFAENYVVVKLIVQESDDKKKQENPGGEKLKADLGGAKSGLPFYAILDEKGKKIADANAMPDNGNIGYPGTAEEIATFGKLLKQTAPRMTSEQLAKLMACLTANAPK